MTRDTKAEFDGSGLGSRAGRVVLTSTSSRMDGQPHLRIEASDESKSLVTAGNFESLHRLFQALEEAKMSELESILTGSIGFNRRCAFSSNTFVQPTPIQ
jgi:hypothetical protein